jgi:hypothetical protein
MMQIKREKVNISKRNYIWCVKGFNQLLEDEEKNKQLKEDCQKKTYIFSSTNKNIQQIFE